MLPYMAYMDPMGYRMVDETLDPLKKGIEQVEIAATCAICILFCRSKLATEKHGAGSTSPVV